MRLNRSNASLERICYCCSILPQTSDMIAMLCYSIMMLCSLEWLETLILERAMHVCILLAATTGIFLLYFCYCQHIVLEYAMRTVMASCPRLLT